MCSQQENKTKLIKLKRKILLTKSFKPKSITKLMEYAQKIGMEIMKAVECSDSNRFVENDTRICDLISFLRHGSFVHNVQVLSLL